MNCRVRNAIEYKQKQGCWDSQWRRWRSPVIDKQRMVMMRVHKFWHCLAEYRCFPPPLEPLVAVSLLRVPLWQWGHADPSQEWRRPFSWATKAAGVAVKICVNDRFHVQRSWRRSGEASKVPTYGAFFHSFVFKVAGRFSTECNLPFFGTGKLLNFATILSKEQLQHVWLHRAATTGQMPRIFRYTSQNCSRKHSWQSPRSQHQSMMIRAFFFLREHPGHVMHIVL